LNTPYVTPAAGHLDETGPTRTARWVDVVFNPPTCVFKPRVPTVEAMGRAHRKPG